MTPKDYRYIVLLLIILTLDSFHSSHAQIEKIIVETYYISDANDATDTLGGRMEEGSVAYRLFVDMAEGSKLVSIFGDADHPISFESTAPFFNNKLIGKTFGHKISSSGLRLNTLALDTWLTIHYPSTRHYAVMKEEDPDTSVIGGKNNDGGSAQIAGGLLVNANPLAGVPLTSADGMVQLTGISTDYTDNGILDPFSGTDTTIFGKSDNNGLFFSKNMRFQSAGGVSGYGPENKILIAQLTTKGLLKFHINLEVFVPNESGGQIIKYVSKDTLLNSTTIYSNWLSYPLQCGCTDPDFVEFDKSATCDDGSCQTPIVFGCTDPLACNYNPDANYHLPELCCYNSKCALDLGIVCPGIIYGCRDPLALNYNANANASSAIDTCCYIQGCRSSRYLEYNPQACIHNASYCKVLVVTGCMDKTACNFNPFVNNHDSLSCIYTGETCQDKSKVEHTSFLNTNNKQSMDDKVIVFPNPVANKMTYMIQVESPTTISVVIKDINGKSIYLQYPQKHEFSFAETIDMSGFSSGFYQLQIQMGEELYFQTIIKE